MKPTEPFPFSEESEKSLLCCLCLSKHDLEDYVPLLPFEAFYIPAHQIIFRALKAILEKSMVLDFHILKHVINLNGELEEVGGVHALNDIWSYLHFAAGTEVHFDSVKSLYQARVTLQEINHLAKTLRNPKALVEETVQEHVERVLTKIAISTKVEEKSFKMMVMDAYEKLCDPNVNNTISGVTFGIESLDQELYGIQPGEKCVVAAQTGGGKSALASQAVIQNSLSGRSSAVFSLEMSAESLIHRMMANVGNVSMTSIKRRRMWEDEAQRLTNATAKIGLFRIFPDPARDITSIVSRCRYLKNKEDISLVVVDYVQLVGSKNSNSKERHERMIADIIHSLSDIAAELGVAVIALSQLNDEGYLRDSRAIGHDADIVLKIEDSDKDDKISKIIHIQKQRNGEMGGRIPVTFEGQYMTFLEDMSHPEDDKYAYSDNGYKKTRNARSES